jgi:hypothetical protein
MEERRPDTSSPGGSSSSAERQPPPLTRASAFVRFGGVGIVLLCVAAAFLYLGAWFSPNKLTPPRFADGFERVDGIHSGFRLNHAKGVCVSGSFESNGRGACRDINFDPLVLPEGMAPSDDPLLSARSAVYSQSFTRAPASRNYRARSGLPSSKMSTSVGTQQRDEQSRGATTRHRDRHEALPVGHCNKCRRGLRGLAARRRRQADSWRVDPSVTQ